MATVTLDRIWLHDTADLDTYLSFYSADRSDSRSGSGEVRAYANGRKRIVTRILTRQTLGVTLRQVTFDDLATLEGWVGTLLMLRDHLGRLVFGTYFSLEVSDYADRSGHDVTFQFVDATHSIEV